jgi:VWFA-related protein
VVKILTRFHVAVALLVVAGAAFAQRAPAPQGYAPEKPPAKSPPKGQVGGLRFLDVSEVTVVNVEVSVTDKNGPVLDLKPGDFEVYQDGKLQPLTNFALYTRPPAGTPAPQATPTAIPTAPAAAAPATPESTTPEPPAPPKRTPRFITFYVDNENIMPMNRNRVLRKVVDWVETYLRPPDQAMVVSYQRSLKVLQPFTSDPEEIAAALRMTYKYTGGATDINSSRGRVEDYINDNAGQASALGSAIDQAKGFAREQYNTLTFTVGALRELIGMLTGLPGKKAVIYVSDGLAMTPGLELFYEIQDQFQYPSIISEAREFDATDLFRGLVNTATAADVTFYTIDAKGLESNLGIEAENRYSRSPLAAGIGQQNYQDSLSYMASETGGLAILNANDPTSGLEKIASDFDTYYSLGYRLIPTGQDRVHFIQVKVKGHKDYRLVYRQRFIEKSLPTRIGDRVMSGLAFDLEDNPLDIDLTTGDPAAASNGRWTLPVDVRVPLDKVALIPNGDKLVGYIMVYYAARDTEGKQSDLQHVEHEIDVPVADYQKTKRDYYTVSAKLLLEPGTYRISVGVRDELTNQAGYALAKRAVHPESE